MDENSFEQVFPIGEPDEELGRHFSGKSYFAPLIDGTVPVKNVTFEPGCRIHWHIHHGSNGAGDQILLCTAGSGWYQAEGEEPVSLEPGSAIRIPAGVKHWHGAKADSWFSHLTFTTPGEGISHEGLEPVTDEYYNNL